MPTQLENHEIHLFIGPNPKIEKFGFRMQMQREDEKNHLLDEIRARGQKLRNSKSGPEMAKIANLEKFREIGFSQPN